MLKFLVDENFDNAIVRGLIRRQPDIDLIRVQDTELSEIAGKPCPSRAGMQRRRVRNPIPEQSRQSLDLGSEGMGDERAIDLRIATIN
jgi:hypothetical protein